MKNWLTTFCRELCFVLALAVPIAVWGHSGGTDAKGGHYDHSTGDYHYHHGHPAHYHDKNGCPYRRKSNGSGSRILFAVMIGGGALISTINASERRKQNEKKRWRNVAITAWAALGLYVLFFLC